MHSPSVSNIKFTCLLLLEFQPHDIPFKRETAHTVLLENKSRSSLQLNAEFLQSRLFANDRTCLNGDHCRIAGVVVSKAPCAHPSFTASSGDSPAAAHRKSPLANPSPPPTRSRTSSSHVGEAYVVPPAHATAPQLWQFFECTSRRVVATTLTFGYFFTTASIMPMKAVGSSFDFAVNLRPGNTQSFLEIFFISNEHVGVLCRSGPQFPRLFSVRPKYSRASRGSSGRN